MTVGCVVVACPYLCGSDDAAFGGVGGSAAGNAGRLLATFGVEASPGTFSTKPGFTLVGSVMPLTR